MGCINYGLLWLHVLETSHPGATGLCWSGMCILKVGEGNDSVCRLLRFHSLDTSKKKKSHNLPFLP